MYKKLYKKCVYSVTYKSAGCYKNRIPFRICKGQILKISLYLTISLGWDYLTILKPKNVLKSNYNKVLINSDNLYSWLIVFTFINLTMKL